MTSWPRPSTTRRRREVVDSASKFADYLREMTRDGQEHADSEAAAAEATTGHEVTEWSQDLSVVST